MIMSAGFIVGWPVSGWGNGCIARVMKQPTVHVDVCPIIIVHVDFLLLLYCTCLLLSSFLLIKTC